MRELVGRVISSFTKDEQKLLLVVALVAGLGYGGLALKKSFQPALGFTPSQATVQTGTQSVPAKGPLLPDGKLDLNRASEGALEALPGVGPSLAQGIVQYRQKSGGFHHFSDLDNVHGIGPSKLEKLRPLAGVRDDPASTAAPQQSGSIPVSQLASSIQPAIAAGNPAARRMGTGTNANREIININSADISQLETLHRIGPALAGRIIQYRQAHGPFHTIEELDRVKGIGPKTIAANRPRLSVN